MSWQEVVYWHDKAMGKCGDPNSFYPPGYVDNRGEDNVASVPCKCCKEPVFDLNLLFTLPCGNKVCETCYYYDFEEAFLCPDDPNAAGTDVKCLDCIFSLVEAGPGYCTHSDADPGL